MIKKIIYNNFRTKDKKISLIYKKSEWLFTEQKNIAN